MLKVEWNIYVILISTGLCKSICIMNFFVSKCNELKYKVEQVPYYHYPCCNNASKGQYERHL